MFYILVADDTGALLVRSGLVSAGGVEEARAHVEDDGGTIGERLVETGVVSDEALTDVYLQYLQVPRVSASTLSRLPVAAMAAIPHTMAIALRAIPISRDHNNNLWVAMSDPLDGRAIEEIAAYTGARVVRAVATQMQIAWCLAHYYDHLTRLGKRLLQSDSGPTSTRRGADPQPRTARSRTASGEIRVDRGASKIAAEPPTSASTREPVHSQPRAAGAPGASSEPRVRPTTVREPESIDLGVEQSGRIEEDTAKIVARHRQRPTVIQPPELEARSGEVELRTGPEPEVSAEPSIVVSLDPMVWESTPPMNQAPAAAARLAQASASSRLAKRTYIGVPVGPNPESLPQPGTSDDRTGEDPISTGGDPEVFDFDDSTDPSWGPPGTTIPPPLRGQPVDDIESDAIPIANPDTQPLPLARESLTERSRPHSISDSDLARHLEDATGRVLDLIHVLESASDRDAVVAALILHIGEAHLRAGLFVTRGNELALFSIAPPTATLSAATLRLDRSSTLQEVIDARLPYRGPMHDPDSRSFLEAVLGACPAEILLVPIAVRERVVGVLFGEHRTRHTFDDQLALVARAAGIALERILMAKRG